MIQSGNALEKGRERRGWFVGQFMTGSHHSDDVEIKWAFHAAGEARNEWSPGDAGHSISILIRGKFVLMFDDGERVLESEGDYVLWGPGERHTWRTEEDTVICTVRWPSIPR